MVTLSSPGLSHRFKRIRFILLIAATLAGLFYYSFLNEEYELNQQLEEEEMPRVTDEVDQIVPVELSSWESVKEKNRYFPMLENEQTEGKVDYFVPDEYFLHQKETKLRKHKKKLHYPIGKENFYKLPKMKKGENYPMIQSSHFNDGGRKVPEKLQRIKKAFMSSWKTYKQYGYGHDEVRPLSHKASDPFNGWSATLVDSLDTLYLIDEKEELREAIEFLKSVNFKQCHRTSIPIFENVIRVLGGLISAYELTSDKSLLQNGQDLAQFIMEAFDTPNRMPLLYYQWQSEIQNKFASKTASLAEVGTLSLEFSKLSQLSGDNRYFDAITRITDAFEESSKNFALPGLYSNHIDISGCNVLSKKEVDEGLHLNNPKVVKTIRGREYIYCKLNSEIKPSNPDQEFSIGGLADSFYEYMPKMFHFLRDDSRFAPTYKKMYLSALGNIKNYMLFRPKIPNSPDVLFISTVSSHETSEGIKISAHNEMQHLSCFAGGMLALGSRLFNLPKDMEIAEKITMGCVHLYQELNIMPEVLIVDRMEGNEDLYDEKEKIAFIKKVTESEESTINGRPRFTKLSESESEEIRDKLAKQLKKSNELEQEEIMRQRSSLDKRSEDETISIPRKIEFVTPRYRNFAPLVPNEEGSYSWPTVRTKNQPIWINDFNPKYILRPEAIESVFYMYRTTGDSKWRDYGWMMWENVERVCQKDGEYAEVADIFMAMDDPNRFKDSLESFWFSETLKYFYLLFEDISVWSLDDYVYNTEAHPFKLAG
jgi:mannosyl-oligosaccharide alpha-1,2-mannosidase